MSTRLIGNLAGVAAMIVWATGLPAAAHILQTWHPLLVMPARMALAGAILIVMMLIFERVPHISATMWKTIALCGAALGVSALGVVWGQRYANPVNVAIVSATMPAISAAIGWVTGKERLTLTIIGGVLLSFCGGLLCLFGAADAGVPVTGHQGAFGLGELLIFVSTGLFVLYARFANDRLSDLSDFARAATTLTASSLVILPVTIFAGVTGLVELTYSLDIKTLGLLAWLGCIAIGVSTLFWMISCRMLGVTVAAMHNNLIPFYAIMFAMLLGDAVTPMQMMGSVLVISGAVLSQTTFRRAKFRPK